MSDQNYELDPKIQEQRRQRREELRRKRAQRKIVIYAALAVILILVLVLSIRSCTNKTPDDDVVDPNPDQTTNENVDAVVPPEQPQEPVKEDTHATLSAIGDIMCYEEQIADALQADGSYDFTASFAKVADLLGAADLTVANLETNFAGTPYSGYPTFSSPPELAKAMADAGIDILQTANTYSMENGMAGLRTTIETIEEYGMQSAGTYGTQEEANENGGVVIREINDIKFAFIAFTKGINGRTRPADNAYCVNLLYTDYTSTYSSVDENALIKSVQSAKALEADVIIALLHWGGEYDIEPNDTQTAIADLLFKNGVDVILGSHAHVVGPMEKRTVTTVDGESKEVFIAYNLGNFISRMTKEGTQASVVLNLSFTKSGETGETTITAAEYVPGYIADHGEGADVRYEVLDIAEEVDHYIGNADGHVSEELYSTIKAERERIRTNAGAEFEAK